jgi:trans-aconitate 3-methyltransferase
MEEEWRDRDTLKDASTHATSSTVTGSHITSWFSTTMAAFAELTYNTIGYAARRPTYPRQLFDFVFKYHERTKGARWDTAVDLGCGPGQPSSLSSKTASLMLSRIQGQATTGLARFKRVIGTDPSQTMLATAREHSKSLGLTNCEFINAHAESLPFLEEGSVDLLVAGGSIVLIRRLYLTAA